MDVSILLPALGLFQHVQAALGIDHVGAVHTRLAIGPDRKSDSVWRRIVKSDVEYGCFGVDSHNHSREPILGTDLKIESQLRVPGEHGVGGVTKHTHNGVVVQDGRVPLVPVEEQS